MARKKNRIILYLHLICLTAVLVSRSYSQPIPIDKKFTDSILPLLPSMPDDSTKVKCLVELSQMHFGVNGDKSIAFAIEGETLARKIGYKKGITHSLRQQAFYYGVTGDWPKASYAINLLEKHDSSEAVFVSNMKWLVSATRNDTLDALKWALKSLQHPGFNSVAEIDKWASYMQVTRSYTTIGKLDSAEFYAAYLKQFIPKYGAIIPDLKMVSLQSLGEIAIRRKNYIAALEYFRLSDGSLGLAKTFHEMKQSDSAIHYALLSMENKANFLSPGFVIEAATILVEEYRLKDPASALKYQQVLINTQDKLYNAQKLKQIEAVNLEHQQQEFALREKEEADRNKLLRTVFLVALSFLSLFVFVLWRNNNAKRIANLKLEQSFKDLEAAQSQLIQSEKMASLGELTAGVAHEIQNPLNFVNNFSDVNQELIMELKEEIGRGNMQEVEKIADSIRDNEAKINHHGKRADAIVKNMLQHSRASNGQKEFTDLNALCDEYLRLSYHGLRAKDKSFNATLETDYAFGAGKVKVIPQEIGRVLLNLFNNAFYAVHAKASAFAEASGGTRTANMSAPAYKPTVSVTTRQLENKAEIIIQDNGQGISAELQKKIFQPFFTTKPTGQGTGLGLSLSYDIITKGHNGRLMVESEEGKGAIFVIQLPIA